MLNFSKTVDLQNAERTSAEKDSSKFAVIARASFVIYIFFIFFGTQLPFQDAITDVEDIATSNLANQVIVSLLFLTSTLTLIPKRKQVFSLIKKEKFLSLFFIWCLISIAWSNFGFVSFKRLFQVIAAVSIGLAGWLYADDSEDIIKYFKWVLFAYILLSIVSVLAVPGAKDPKFMTWRGMAPTKNHLGQAGLISTLFWLNAVYIGSKRQRAIALVMVMFSFILLLGSQSATAIATLVLLAMIWLAFWIDDRFKSMGIGRLFVVMASITSLAVAALVLYLAPELLTAIIGQVGKDTTFSGRTDLWIRILEEVKKHVLLGSGFGAFWVMENPDLQYLYRDFVWLPRQAHLGYLDILNETGLVGLALFSMAVLACFKKMLSFEGHGVWKWFLVAVLIVNLQETTLFRPNILTGTLFIFSYLALYADAIVREASN
jgi:O-antigen ligase